MSLKALKDSMVASIIVKAARRHTAIQRNTIALRFVAYDIEQLVLLARQKNVIIVAVSVHRLIVSLLIRTQQYSKIYQYVIK